MKKSILTYVALALITLAVSACSQSPQPAYPFCKDRQCGLMDRSGNTVLEPQYTNIYQLSETYFIVTLEDGSKQIMLVDGTKVYTGPFQQVRSFSPDLFILKTEGVYALVDHDFARISPDTEYDNITHLQDGYAVVSKDGLGGVVNAKGKLVLPVDYGYLRLVGQGKAVGQAELEPALFDLKTGEYTNGPQFSDMGDFSEDRASFRGEDGRFGYIDLKGDIVIPAQFESNRSFENGHVIVRRDGEQYVIDKSGKSLFGDTVYGSVSRHGDDLFQVTPYRMNSRSIPRYGESLIGLADISGALVVDHTWPSATYPKGNVFAAYITDSKLWALFDLRGNQISEPRFEDVRLLTKKRAWIYKDGLYYVIDLDTEEVVSPRGYDSRRVDSEGFASVKLGGLYGLVGPEGQEIVPPIFDSLVGGSGAEFGYMTLRISNNAVYSVLKDGTPIGFSFDDIPAPQ